MPDTPVTALDTRQHKLLENARRAFEQGHDDYVVTVCAQILRTHPGCQSVRRLQRAAQLRSFQRGGGLRKALGGLTALPFVFGRKEGDPRERLARAEKWLASDPVNVSALKLLAEAAEASDWPETVAFAREAICALEPENRGHSLALGAAWLDSGKPEEALRIADELLRANPVDGDAQSLMRRASIARTTREGHWEGEGDYREKLRSEEASAAVERTTRRVASTPASRGVNDLATDAPLQSPRETARDAVERYPGDLDARFRLAELLAGAGETEAAIAQYQHSQKSPKLRARSLLGLARCFRSRRLLDLSVVQLNTAKGEVAPGDELSKAISYELGCCYEELQQPEAAIAEFKEIYTGDIGFRDVAAKINTYYGHSKPPA